MLLALRFTGDLISIKSIKKINQSFGHSKIKQFTKVAFIKTSSHTGTTELTEAQNRNRTLVLGAGVYET